MGEEIDYKALYEQVVRDNEKLRERTAKMMLSYSRIEFIIKNELKQLFSDPVKLFKIGMSIFIMTSIIESVIMAKKLIRE